jgi:acetyltransferase-like isoleucine patch superfamily enzyme
VSHRISLPMKFIAPIDFFNQKLYMKLYRKILVANGVIVNGEPLWISHTVYFDAKFPGAITLGHRCGISGEVKLLTHDFSMDRIAEMKFGQTDKEIVRRAPIVIGDYAVVGLCSIVLPGITIGRGAMVGAGSVVTKDVPDGHMVAGNPAKFICTTDEWWEKSRDKFEWHDRRR